MDNSEKFLEDFNRLEEYFRKITHSNKYVNFMEMVNSLQSNYYISKKYDTLRQLADLRNTIVHKRGTEIYANPTDIALLTMESIREQIMTPKRVFDIVKNKPIKFESSTLFIDVIKTIKEMEYSQFPIYEEKKYVGLLSSNSVVLWLANTIDGDNALVEDLSRITVKEIIQYNEELDKAKFVNRNIDVNEFAQLLLDNKDTLIWIITENGNRNETPLCIITPYDFEKIFNELI